MSLSMTLYQQPSTVFLSEESQGWRSGMVLSIRLAQNHRWWKQLSTHSTNVSNMMFWFLLPRFNPLVGKIPWGRKWQPTPVFLPGEYKGQRSLAGYSSRGHQKVRHKWATNTHTNTLFSFYRLLLSELMPKWLPVESDGYC